MSEQTWEPDLASIELEEKMEAQEVPESDRDEIRRYAEFLRRRKNKKDGKALPPAQTGMREWLLGVPLPPPPTEEK